MANQINNVLAFDLETFNDVVNAIPYAAAFYPVSKLIMKWNRDLTKQEIEKCLSNGKFFMGHIVVLPLCLTIYLEIGKERKKVF